MNKKFVALLVVVGLFVSIILIVFMNYLTDKNQNHVDPNDPEQVFKSTIIEGVPDFVVQEQRESKKKREKLLKTNPEVKKLFNLAEAQKDPVEFHALILDQNGEPVPDVSIIVGLGGVYGSSVVDAKSDQNGRVYVTGVNATSMSFHEIKKEGYEFNREGSFRSHIRSGTGNLNWHDYTRDNPYIYRAWKKSPADRLLHVSRIKLKIKNKKWYTVNFSKRNYLKEGKLEKGDLHIKFKKNQTTDQEYDWSIEMAPINGGIVETKDVFMYQAPESGYKDKWQYENQNVRRSDGYITNFYMNFHNGKQYGRFDFDIGVASYRELPNITVSYWINKNSSRNLYYDPKKLIFPEWD